MSDGSRASMRVSLPTLGFILLASCRSGPSPEGAEGLNAPASEAVAVTSKVVEPVAVVQASGLPFDAYRTQVIRQLMRLTKSREVTLAPKDRVESLDEKLPHSAEVLKKIGQTDSFIVTTAGFGRFPQGEAQNRVEFIASVSSHGRKISDVLSALGRAMIARGPDAPAWKEYDTVQLPQSEHGLEYFDLRPAGELAIDEETRVVLLKVLPMSAEEFERSHRNAAGEWDDPNAAARAVARWRRLVEP